MKRIVMCLFLMVLTACSACIEDDELVRLECIPGEKVVCGLEGKNYPNATTNPMPTLVGQCSYGIRTCTSQGCELSEASHTSNRPLHPNSSWNWVHAKGKRSSPKPY